MNSLSFSWKSKIIKMKKIISLFLIFVVGLYGSKLQAQILSVGLGNEFDIGAGTIISLDSLELNPSATYSFSNNTLSKSDTVSNSTTITYINKVYQFSATSDPYSGVLKLYYNNNQLNGLTASGLKLLLFNGTSWSLDNNSSSITASNVVLNDSVIGVSLKEISAATCSPNTGDTTASACGNFVWYGVTYTASATPTRTFTNAAGCDSVVTLNLTIRSSNTGSSSSTACDTYTWSGSTYTTSGTYTKTLTNVAGCDSVHSLTLTINTTPSTPSVNVVNNCNGTSTLSTTASGTLLWSTTETTSSINVNSAGTYTLTQTVNGCISASGSGVAAPKTTNTSSSSATACDTYTWSGSTYTTSGTYTKTLTNVAGCDSVHSLTLTINTTPSTPSVNVVNNCDGTSTLSTTASGTLLWNTTATTSSINVNSAGTYTLTQTVNGCISASGSGVAAPKTSNAGSSSATACNTYTWTGTTYATSGTYTKTLTNVASCDSVHTLTLTINSSNTGSSSATACNTYTWTGSTYTTSGVFTKTFTNVANCDSVHTLNLTINYSSSSSVTVSQLGCYTWSLNSVTYTVSGNYSLTYTNAIGCDSIVTLNLSITPGVYLNAKAILSGPYVTAAALMHDSLRVNGLIPTTEPYTASPYNKTAVGGTSGETVSNAILNVSGSNAIVDWVLVELRNALTNSTVVANKRALIQRDGDIVSSTDGTSPVYFPTVANGNYYVSVKHRNHLGVMSLNAISFSGCSTSSIDFTTSNAVYNISPTLNLLQRKQIGAVYALWSGDGNNNKNVKYNGLSNDKDGLVYVIGVSTLNNTVSGVYRVEDVNMDGKIRYTNTDNDKSVILNNVGVSTPNNLYFQHTPN
jgi:hypothetical protein